MTSSSQITSSKIFPNRPLIFLKCCPLARDSDPHTAHNSQTVFAPEPLPHSTMNPKTYQTSDNIKVSFFSLHFNCTIYFYVLCLVFLIGIDFFSLLGICWHWIIDCLHKCMYVRRMRNVWCTVYNIHMHCKSQSRFMENLLVFLWELVFRMFVGGWVNRRRQSFDLTSSQTASWHRPHHFWLHNPSFIFVISNYGHILFLSMKCLFFGGGGGFGTDKSNSLKCHLWCVFTAVFSLQFKMHIQSIPTGSSWGGHKMTVLHFIIFSESSSGLI